MKIEIRLQNVLKEHKLDHHGIIQQIASNPSVGVNRHTIAKFYNNSVKNVSLDALGKLCEWLSMQGVPIDKLPGELFGTRPSELWKTIAAKGKVAIYLGEYQQTESPASAWRWIARRDAAVAANFVQELSNESYTGVSPPQVRLEYVPFRWDTKINDVTQSPLVDDIKKAKKIYSRMKAGGSHHTSILIGSQRVNYLLEFLVADLFGCTPFSKAVKGHDVPFYLVYRDKDRKVTSCFGGEKNPHRSKNATVPGIHYLSKKGWAICPWKENKQDAGIIIALRNPSNDVITIAVFGFSGRATDTVGKQLLLNKDRFWSSMVNVRGKEIGIYICSFELDQSNQVEDDEGLWIKNLEIINLNEKILKQYLH
jgi:DNA-binding Xre family transcriptional regulator